MDTKETERERYEDYEDVGVEGLRKNLAHGAAQLEAIAEGPAEGPAPNDDEEGEGGDEDGFCAPAVREIVAAYRATAMKQRDLLLARLRQACARLGAEAACFASWDPNEQALNARLGQFQARAIFCLRGICPLDAQTWLDANVGEIEGLHARTRDEYEQAGLVLSGVEDRLFGLLYDLAREK